MKNKTALKGMVAAGLVVAVMVVVGCKKGPDGATTPPGGTEPAAKKREVHKAPDGAALKLAFVTNNSSEFWNAAQKGVNKFEKENPGVKVDVKMPENTVQSQNQVLDDLLANGYNGIAVSPIAPKDQTRELNKLAAAMNLITQDSDAPASNRLAYIGTNNYEAGKMLGGEIVKLLPQGGKIAVFVGTFSADNAAQRLKGVEDATAGHNITIAAKKEDNKNQATARAMVDDVLTAQPDVKLLVGLWSYNGEQIAKGIEAAGKKGQVLAAVFDYDPGTLDGIQSGIISCTVVQQPFEFGYQASKLLYQLAKNGESALPKTEIIDIPADVVDAKNITQFRAKLAEMNK